MLMNILLGATMYPSLIIVFFVEKTQSFKNRNMIFGVRLPEEMQDSEPVRQIMTAYNKQMKMILIAMLLSPILCFFTHYTSIQFTLWMVWFLGGLFIMNLPYILANKAAMTLREELSSEEDSEIDPGPKKIYAELKTVRTVKLLPFLLPMLLSILPPFLLFLRSADEREVFLGVSIVFGLLTPLFFFVACWMDRLPTLVISEDSSINVAYNRARKNIWKNAWLFLSWLNALAVVSIIAAVMLDFRPFGSFLDVTIIESLLGVLSMLWASRKIRQVDDAYAVQKEDTFDRDDDCYWIWGMFYNNPHDKRTFVEKRFGIGMTTNMATRTGKVTIWVAILALIWIPFMCLWLVLEEFTPMHIRIQDQSVVCSHLKEDYVIPVDSIEEVTLLTVPPLNRHKISGTGTDTMEKGKYNAGKIGAYYSFIDPTEEAFLLIKTDKASYLICGDTKAETEMVYEALNINQ